MTDFESDAVKIAGSYFAKPLGIVGLIVGVGVFGYCHGKSVAGQTVEHQARVDTVRIAEAAAKEKAETVTVRLKAQARIDTLVKVASDTTVVIHADTVRVPPQIVERIVTDDRTIVALRSYITADSAKDLAKDRLYAMPKPERRWSLGVSGGYGPQLEHDRTVRLGWNVHLGIGFRLF